MTMFESHNLIVIVVLLLATALVVLGKLSGAEWAALVGTVYVAANTIPAKMAAPATGG